MDNQKYEKIIGYLIYENMMVEWMRFNMYVESDIYASVPMLVFRIHDEEQDRINRLKDYIFEYNGYYKWSLFICPLTRKKNYILSLKIVEELYNEVAEGTIKDFDPKNILGEKKYKQICYNAIQEIPDLAKYIENFFACSIDK